MGEEQPTAMQAETVARQLHFSPATIAVAATAATATAAPAAPVKCEEGERATGQGGKAAADSRLLQALETGVNPQHAVPSSLPPPAGLLSALGGQPGSSPSRPLEPASRLPVLRRFAALCGSLFMQPQLYELSSSSLPEVAAKLTSVLGAECLGDLADVRHEWHRLSNLFRKATGRGIVDAETYFLNCEVAAARGRPKADFAKLHAAGFFPAAWPLPLGKAAVMEAQHQQLADQAAQGTALVGRRARMYRRDQDRWLTGTIGCFDDRSATHEFECDSGEVIQVDPVNRVLVYLPPSAADQAAVGQSSQLQLQSQDSQSQGSRAQGVRATASQPVLQQGQQQRHAKKRNRRQVESGSGLSRQADATAGLLQLTVDRSGPGGIAERIQCVAGCVKKLIGKRASKKVAWPVTRGKEELLKTLAYVLGEKPYCAEEQSPYDYVQELLQWSMPAGMHLPPLIRTVRGSGPLEATLNLAAANVAGCFPDRWEVPLQRAQVQAANRGSVEGSAAQQQTQQPAQAQQPKQQKRQKQQRQQQAQPAQTQQPKQQKRQTQQRQQQAQQQPQQQPQRTLTERERGKEIQLANRDSAPLPCAATVAAVPGGLAAAELPAAAGERAGSSNASLAERSKAVVKRRLDEAVGLFDVNAAPEELTLRGMRQLVSVGVGGKSLQEALRAWAGCPDITKQHLLRLLVCFRKEHWEDLEERLRLCDIVQGCAGGGNGVPGGLLQAQLVASASQQALVQLQDAEPGDPATMLKPLQTLLTADLGGVALKEAVRAWKEQAFTVQQQRELFDTVLVASCQGAWDQLNVRLAATRALLAGQADEAGGGSGQ